jgi:thiosulfate/3-mercaptopyruvate sulfurtransferase
MALFRTSIRLFHSSAARKMTTSAISRAPFLLSPRQVSELTNSGDASSVSFLDSTWFMPNSPRNAKEEFHSKRIPGSQFLDLDEVASSHELGLKHMMPDSQTFAKACGTVPFLTIRTSLEYLWP